MRKHLFALLALCLIGTAALAQTPISATITLGTNDTTAVWTVPAGAPGPLLSLQAAELGSTTGTVTHLLPYAGGGIITNSVATLTSTSVSAHWPVDAREAVPVWLARGDKLKITLDKKPTVPVKIVVRIGKE